MEGDGNGNGDGDGDSGTSGDSLAVAVVLVSFSAELEKDKVERLREHMTFRTRNAIKRLSKIYVPLKGTEKAQRALKNVFIALLA